MKTVELTKRDLSGVGQAMARSGSDIAYVGVMDQAIHVLVEPNGVVVSLSRDLVEEMYRRFDGTRNVIRGGTG